MAMTERVRAQSEKTISKQKENITRLTAELSESNALRATVRELEHSLAASKEETDRLTAELDGMQKERETLVQQLKRRPSLPRPSSSLPTATSQSAVATNSAVAAATAALNESLRIAEERIAELESSLKLRDQSER